MSWLRIRALILKEFIMASRPTPRLLMQMKCLEKFKYERSEAENHELNWSVAMQRWIEEGHAAKFAMLYSDGIKFRELYKALTAS